MSITTKKPEAPTSRFAKAKEFGRSGQVESTAAAETNEPSEDVSLIQKKSVATKRENFDLDVDLGFEMRKFLLTSPQFRNKREFLTQCLRDGLEKYANK